MKQLEIILRTCDIRNVHQDWRVRYVNMPKDQIVLGCTASLINSCLGIPGIKITVFDDHSSQPTVDGLKYMLTRSKIEHEFISLEENGYNNSAHHQYIRCRDSEYNLVYAVEDDYLHCPSAIKEILDSYMLFSERIKDREIVLYPFDAPDDYNPPSRADFLVHGSHRHWRTGIGSTQVLIASPKLFRTYWDLFETLALKYNGDYLKPRAEHYDEGNTIHKIWNNGPAIRFNPVPSLALHLQFNEQRDPFINWQQWWNDYTKF